MCRKCVDYAVENGRQKMVLALCIGDDILYVCVCGGGLCGAVTGDMEW